MTTQANVSSTSHKGPVYNFGIMIPHNVKQAFELDAKNGNTLWKDAMAREFANIQSYQTFKDMGVKSPMSLDTRRSFSTLSLR
jgi:nitric oxide synthase oxygenase domain/subunit